jgi:hypothetical protein
MGLGGQARFASTTPFNVLGGSPSIIIGNLVPVFAESGFMLRFLPVFTEGRRRSDICLDEHHAYRNVGRR